VCFPQVGNILGKTPVPRAGSSRSDCWATRLRPRRAAAGVAGSPVEGTSGSANPALLRGRAGEAALGPRCVRASDTPRARGPCPSRAGSVRWDRRGAGVSSQRGSGFATRGVRADRVGVMLAHGCSSERAGASGRGFGPGRTWPVKPRLVAVDARSGASASSLYGGQRYPCRCRGAVGRRGFGRALDV
jgi:hypothetical protein